MACSIEKATFLVIILEMWPSTIRRYGSIINVGVQEIELQHFSINLDKNIEHNVKIL
jgi:hypothetical protein